MPEYDRIEATQKAHAIEHFLSSVYHHDHLVPKMHAILAQPTTGERRYKDVYRINRDLEFVRDGPEKMAIFEKTQPIIQELYDTHHKRVKNLPDDQDFYWIPESVREVVKAPPPPTTLPETVRSEIESVRSVGVDLAEQAASGVGKTGFGALIGGALLNAGGRFVDGLAGGVSSLFSSSNDKEQPDIMNAKERTLLDRFIATIQSGRSVEKSIATYRHKTNNNPDSYTLGLKTLLTSDDYQHKLSEAQKTEIEKNYMEHEQVTPLTRWANSVKRKTPSSDYAYDYSSGPADPPNAKEAPTPPPSSQPQTPPTPPPQAPPVPTPPTKKTKVPSLQKNKEYVQKSNEEFFRRMDETARKKQAEEQQAETNEDPDTPSDPLLQPLPSIPRDPSVYNVAAPLNYDEAAWGAMGQTLLRGGVAGGAYLTKQALQMGGYQGYLGAAALGAGTMSLDALSRMYGGDYGTSHSTRRGMKVGDVMFDNFSMTNPTLSVERGINALLSSSENERSSGTVVDIFTKSGSQLANSQGIGDQVAQENLALRNWLADSTQIVVPRAY